MKMTPPQKKNQNLSDSKAVLRWKFIAIQSYLQKQEKISKSLTLHLKQLEKEEETKLKVRKGKKS